MWREESHTTNGGRAVLNRIVSHIVTLGQLKAYGAAWNKETFETYLALEERMKEHEAQNIRYEAEYQEQCFKLAQEANSVLVWEAMTAHAVEAVKSLDLEAAVNDFFARNKGLKRTESTEEDYAYIFGEQVESIEAEKSAEVEALRLSDNQEVKDILSNPNRF